MLKTRSIKIAIAIFCIIFEIKLYGQPSIVQSFCYGTTSDDYFTDAITSNDGNLLATAFYGGIDGDALEYDTLLFPTILMKLDTSLNLIWTVGYGGTDGFTTLLDLEKSNSDYILAGISSATNGTFTDNHGGEDIAILKVDSNGNVIWSKSIGSSGLDTYSSIAPTSDNGFIITASSAFEDGNIPDHYGSSVTRDVIVAKLNSNGTIKWIFNYGGSEDEVPLGDPVEIEPNKYIIQAQSQSTDYDLAGLGFLGETKRWLFELDSVGNIIKKNAISSIEDITIQDGETFINDQHDLVIVGCGYASSALFPAPTGHAGFEGAIAYINDDLELSSMTQFGGTGTDFLSRHYGDENNMNYYIGVSTSPDYDLPGNYNKGATSDYWLMEIDSNSNLLWSFNFGGSTSDGELGGSNFYGSLVELNSSLYFFGKCTVPDTIPDYDISCGHQLDIPFIWPSDAWIVKFKLDENSIVNSSNNTLFEVYPNPCTDHITIKYSGDNFSSMLKVYNILGQEVYTTRIDANQTEANTSSFDRGIYFFTLEYNGEVVSSQTVFVNQKNN